MILDLVKSSVGIVEKCIEVLEKTAVELEQYHRRHRSEIKIDQAITELLLKFKIK